jgi:Uri superfamily endonuclease
MFSAVLDPLKSWADVGTLVGGFAAAIGIVVGLIAAGFAFGQMAAAKQSQREAIARGIYSNYLQLAMENPSFARGSQPAEDLEFERYEWFVSYMLNACEHILLFVSDKSGWEQCVAAQLSYHVEYLTKNKWFVENAANHYSSELLSLIDRA